MTSTNFTIDNVNPLILYTPAATWTEGSAADDPLASDYSDGTFTLCTTKGSNATFTFNGTQVFVHGAKRSNHGPYSVTLDGITTDFDGFSENPIFGTLFVSDVLTSGLHTVTVTNELLNQTFPFLDIDFITWTDTVADDGETTTIEDTTTAFSYQPATSWGTDLTAAQLTGFSQNNGHVTITTGASATVTFNGDFITVYGPVGPTISRYTVVVDGVTGGTFNGTKENYTPQVALYYANGLGAGQHTIQLVSEPAVSGQFFAIDYAQILPTASASATPTGVASSTTSNTGGGSKSNVGAAVGGVLAGIAIMILLVFLFFFLRRRKRRRDHGPNRIVLEDKFSPTPASGPSSFSMADLSSSAAPAQVAAPYSVAGSEARLAYLDSESGVRSPPLANPWGSSTEAPSSPPRGFRTVNNDPSVGSASDASSSYGGRTSTVFSAGAAGLGAGGQTSRKGAPLTMPPTANLPLPPGAERMYVPGREQDFGPLPPDYEQATEPYPGRS
ncbi:hypothetical protein DFH07DRAFT_892813 [Mycena maculata]|uniref:Transmembrane protein n=1 Tax=Mycena maculata TaxID=230809 RepID=A0AAD7I974_9AGAR|nr:hypothetical protein DFH07DRAFT_892813 [Mycena maculata]